jgi:hypothetical protein
MPHSQSFIVNPMEKVLVLRLLLSIILYLIAKSWVCNDTAQLLKCLESNQKLGLVLLNFIPLFPMFQAELIDLAVKEHLTFLDHVPNFLPLRE